MSTPAPLVRVRTSGRSGWRIHGPVRLEGELRLGGDKSIAHRALILAALGRGTTVLRNLPEGDDVARTRAALAALGVRIEAREGSVRVHGVGLTGLRRAREPIDCGNSGTTMRLLCGLLAAQPFESLLVGDASLSKRPMDRVARPLRAMGAQVECLGAGDRPPLRVGGTSAVLEGCTHVLDVDSAQVRSAILLAGLRASGPTAIAPAGASRDHTLRMLQALGMHVAGAGGRVVLHPTRPEGWESFDLDVPGDVSSAAFAIAFAAARRGSRLVVGGVALNPGRVRYLALLEQAGAALAVVPRGTALGEPFGDVRVRGGTLRGLRLRGVDVVQCLDEVPALLAAWAVAGSPAVVRDAAELRVKESDRIAGLAALLRAFGARVGEREDGVALSACSALRPARVASGGDHRLAMAAAMLAFGARGASLVEDVGCADTSYPGFARDLLRLARPLAPDSHPAHRSAGDHRPASARKPGPSGERRGRTRPARP